MSGKKSGTDDTEKGIRHSLCLHTSYEGSKCTDWWIIIILIPPPTAKLKQCVKKCHGNVSKYAQFQQRYFVAWVTEENIQEEIGLAQSLRGPELV